MRQVHWWQDQGDRPVSRNVLLLSGHYELRSSVPDDAGVTVHDAIGDVLREGPGEFSIDGPDEVIIHFDERTRRVELWQIAGVGR